MSKPIFTLKVISLVLFLSISSLSNAQIFSGLTSKGYQKIFVETDDFEADYLANLESKLASANIDTTYFSMLNDLAYFSHTRNLTKAYNYVQKGLQLTAQANDSLWYGRFQITQGAILLLREQLDSAEWVLDQAQKKVKESDFPFLYTQRGYLFERRGELDRAVDYALKSMRLGEKLNDKKAIALAYSDLSNLFWKQSKFKVGLEYGLRSVALFKQIGMNSLDYNFTLFTVGNNLQGLEKFADAQWYYEQCVKMGQRYGFYNNLSDVYIFLAELDMKLGDATSALKAGENAVKYADLLDNNFMLMRSWLAVGEAQLAAGLYTKASFSLNKCLAIATDNFGDKYYLSKAYDALGKAYAGNGNYKAAYAAFKKYDLLKSEIFKGDADERIAELQTKFKVAEQNAKIKAQESTMGEQKNRQLLTFLITGFLLLLLLILLINFGNNKKKNALLQKQNKEKEYLLKEIHHRVKNNLGVVSSLLALQSDQIEDEGVKDAMLESQNRVNSMSMIHQKLYQGTNLAAIEMKDYFMNLASHILDSFAMEEQVEVNVDMQPTELDVDTAVPLGLILNELLTNALKFAFPQEKKGLITISLSATDQSTTLKVHDNGIGYDHSLPAKGTGFGTQLISLLVMQLEGEIAYENSQGTAVNLVFKSAGTS